MPDLTARLFALITTLAAAVPATAQAQSSLGVTGASLSFSGTDAKGEGASAGAMLDVAVTANHGLQTNLSYTKYDNGNVGRIASTLYMIPRHGLKYGLSVMVGDQDGVSSTYGQIGAAGIFAISDDLDFEVRAGIGMRTDSDLDWITGGAGIHWQAAPELRLYGQYDIAHFDEAQFSAVAHEVTLGAEYHFKNSPVALFAEASHDWLNGRSGASGETTLRAGISIAVGHAGGNQPSFRVSDPMRQLLRRGSY